MTQIKLSVSTKPLSGKAATAIRVVGASKGKTGAVSLSPDHITDAQLATLGHTGKAESVVRTITGTGELLAVVGIDSEQPDRGNWREIGGALVRALSDLVAVQIDLPFSSSNDLEAFLEGVLLGGFAYRHKTKPQLARVHVITELSFGSKDISRVEVIAAAVNASRRLAATPANLLYPKLFADEAERVAEDLGLDIEVLDEKSLERQGFGLISAVGMGSARGPRLVRLEYKPKGKVRHLALVGKGITFDTGGLAIKPLGGMLGMKYDMAGAATVLAAVSAIAALKIPIRVTAYLCLAENMPSGTAMRPGDVFKARNGKTVEVTNPDAEGRLVLADGIAWASETHPDLIVDVATLTGAARVALGARFAGLMGSEAGIASIQAAANEADELVWPLPLAKELRSALDSPVADLQNSKVGFTLGGALVGGWFISEFVGNGKSGQKLDWAHLDIAGPADNEGPAYGHVPAGPTGAMVRTLISLAQQQVISE